jgi:hypothetical protein
MSPNNKDINDINNLSVKTHLYIVSVVNCIINMKGPETKTVRVNRYLVCGNIKKKKCVKKIRKVMKLTFLDLL